jgi:hypothetical protein
MSRSFKQRRKRRRWEAAKQKTFDYLKHSNNRPIVDH